MKRFFSLFAAAFFSLTATAQPGDYNEFFPQLNSSHIQVVFALDCTGSMSGLIQTAKDKIWTIATSLAQTEEQVTISMGLVAYRDRGDAYVTQITDLNTDLDYVYNQLMQLSAAGGGDGPESVNQALNDAIHQMSWNEGPRSMRSIFLVGDCEPHMDYDEKQYPELCREASKKGITVNTVLMGNNSSARSHWESIAYATSGDFFSVGMNANNLAVTTPHDVRIRELNQKLDGTKLYYGSTIVIEQAAADEVRTKDLYDGLDDAAVARRAAFNMTAAGESNQYGTQELLNEVSAGRVKLEDLEEEEMPEPMREMEPVQRAEYLEQRLAERTQIENELKAEIQARDEYISTTLSDAEAKSGFAAKVWSSLRKQAESNDLALPESVKY